MIAMSVQVYSEEEATSEAIGRFKEILDVIDREAKELLGPGGVHVGLIELRTDAGKRT